MTEIQGLTMKNITSFKVDLQEQEDKKKPVLQRAAQSIHGAASPMPSPFELHHKNNVIKGL